MTHELQKWNGRLIQPPPPDLTIETDASLLGWGAVANGVSTRGLWSMEECQNHTNNLEMLGAALAVQSYTRDKVVSHVHLKMDNQAAICYFNHVGGTRSQTMSNTDANCGNGAFTGGKSAEHLPGSNNVHVTAYQESRTLQSPAE